MKNLTRILESLLFVSEEPLTVSAVKRILDVTDGDPIRQAFAELVDRYRQDDGGFYLAEVANGYQFRTAPESMQWVRRMLQPAAPRLSKAALETLAIIAYKQPVIRADIEHIRGVDCGGVVRMLLERKLVRILGRKEIPGRPLLYATTKQFLQVFDLKDLKELPSPREIEAMAAEQMGTSQADANDDHTEDETSLLPDTDEPSDILEAAGDTETRQAVLAENSMPNMPDEATGMAHNEEPDVDAAQTADADENDPTAPESPQMVEFISEDATGTVDNDIAPIEEEPAIDPQEGAVRPPETP